MFNLLFYLAVGVQFEFSFSCHWTNIVVKNGTWCCEEGAGQRDVGQDVTIPVPTGGTGGTGETPGTTTPVTTTMIPKPPVGDCPCGNHMDGMEQAPQMPGMEEAPQMPQLDRILSQDPYGTSQLNRPWLVHIKLVKDSRKTIECTGSLLNKLENSFHFFPQLE